MGRGGCAGTCHSDEQDKGGFICYLSSRIKFQLEALVKGRMRGAADDVQRGALICWCNLSHEVDEWKFFAWT